MKKMKTLTVNGETFAVCDPEAARIDDSVAGEQAWSGKQILDRLCPAFTESGTIVACEPVEGYPLDVQTAEGATKILRTGKNLLPYPYFDTTKTHNGVTFTDNGDGSITINGISSKPYNTVLYISKDESILKDGVTYCLPPAQGNIQFRFIYEDLEGNSKNQMVPLTWNKDYKNLQVIILISSNAEISDITVYPQLEAGTVATAYEPYRGGEFAPGEAVPALAGVNTLWADAGEITVTGRADPVAILETLMGGAQDVSDSH